MSTDAVQRREEARNKKTGQFGHQRRTQAETKLDYSLIEDWDEATARFEADFDGVPGRFFRADLPDTATQGRHYHEQYLSHLLYQSVPKMTQATSAPADTKISSADIEEAMKDLDIKRINPSNEVANRAFGTDEGWIGRIGAQRVFITRSAIGKKNLTRRRWRVRTPEGFAPGEDFIVLDARHLAGMNRIQRLTGVNLLKATTELGAHDLPAHTRVLHGLDILHAQHSLRQHQETGAAFKLQARHVNSRLGSSVARAWEDKKHPDRIRQEMMRSTRLNKLFSKVEIDNSVDPDKYANFERAVEDALRVLPAPADDKRPALRLRKLGKHKAGGIYFPHVRSIGVDVRDTGSFVHEYGHYLDLTVKGNASMRGDFANIRRTYAQSLGPVPAGGKKADYYQTPTEVFARGFEMYAVERLGVKSQVVNPDRFKRFDYEPFASNPQLKAETFEFFEKLFGKPKKPDYSPPKPAIGQFAPW